MKCMDSMSRFADSEMTVLSREMFECAMDMDNVAEAAESLLRYGRFRTLKDIIFSFGKGGDVQAILVEGLLVWHPTAVRESVARKVRNWLGGTTASIRKEDAFVLSRILGLSLEDTNEFLKRTCGEGIHWRDPEDVVWCYAIVRGLELPRIRKLLERVRAMGNTPKAAEPQPGSYTQEVYERLQAVLEQDEDALMAALESEWSHMGKLHNTAYLLFTQYMELLKKGYLESDRSYLYDEKAAPKDLPRSLQTETRERRAKDQAARIETARKKAKDNGEAFPPDGPGYHLTLEYAGGTPELILPDAFSDQDILEEYLFRKLVPLGNPKEQDAPRRAIQQVIRQSWPDSFSLSRMRKRQVDIPRKLLILLFLATDGDNSTFSDDVFDEEWEEPMSEDETFLDIYTRLNRMLTSCGFLKLDPRSAFDWVILFCISSGDLWESDQRLRGMLAQIFPAEG